MKDAQGNALNNRECSENWVRDNGGFAENTWQNFGPREKEIDASDHETDSHAPVEPDAAIYQEEDQDGNDNAQDCQIH